MFSSCCSIFQGHRLDHGAPPSTDPFAAQCSGGTWKRSRNQTRIGAQLWLSIAFGLPRVGGGPLHQGNFGVKAEGFSHRASNFQWIRCPVGDFWMIIIKRKGSPTKITSWMEVKHPRKSHGCSLEMLSIEFDKNTTANIVEAGDFPVPRQFGALMTARAEPLETLHLVVGDFVTENHQYTLGSKFEPPYFGSFMNDPCLPKSGPRDQLGLGSGKGFRATFWGDLAGWFWHRQNYHPVVSNYHRLRMEEVSSCTFRILLGLDLFKVVGKNQNTPQMEGLMVMKSPNRE